MTDLSHALSEPGTGNPPAPVYPNADKAVTLGWRRDTPGGVNDASNHPPQVGDLTFPPGINTGLEL